MRKKYKGGINMKIKRPLLWAGIIIAIAVIAYCSIYSVGIMIAPRM
jgi:hypothetical protein